MTKLHPWYGAVFAAGLLMSAPATRLVHAHDGSRTEGPKPAESTGPQKPGVA